MLSLPVSKTVSSLSNESTEMILIGFLFFKEEGDEEREGTGRGDIQLEIGAEEERGEKEEEEEAIEGLHQVC